jgi:oligoendopeptidase F
MYYENHPEYRAVWSLIHHYFDVPGYYVNYVFAQALALVFMDKLLSEPGFADRYVALLESPLDRPGPQIVKDATGVDMLDPSVLQSGFAKLESLIEELDALYDRMGI